jgi:hypothetical protein
LKFRLFAETESVGVVDEEGDPTADFTGPEPAQPDSKADSVINITTELRRSRRNNEAENFRNDPNKMPPECLSNDVTCCSNGQQFARGTVEVQLSLCIYLYLGTGARRKCAQKFRWFFFA